MTCLVDEQQLEHPIPKVASYGALSAAEALYGIPLLASQRTSVDLKVVVQIPGNDC